MSKERAYCSIAVYRDGRALSAVTCGCVDHDATVAEWAADPDFRELHRVPVEVARRFLFEQWPGRDEACRIAGVEP